MKRLILTAATVMFGFGMAQAEETPATETVKKGGVIGKVIGDMRESAGIIHEINKESFAEQKRISRERHAQAVSPNPDFVKFKEAKGLRNKVDVIGENIKESCAETAEKEKERREAIKSHESYAKLMKNI